MDNDTFSKIAVTLGRLDERTERIERDLSGNGQPGIRQRVEALEEHQNKITGAVAAVGTLATFLWGGLEYLFHVYKGGK